MNSKTMNRRSHARPAPELERIRQWLHGQDDLRTAIAFGSVASGQAGFDSDLDLAVAGVQPGRPLSAARRFQLQEQLAELCGRPVDLIDLATAGEPVLGEIVNGVRLLGSDADFAALLARYLFDQADFAPLRARILKHRRQTWLES